jgi:hypothetical protein
MPSFFIYKDLNLRNISNKNTNSLAINVLQKQICKVLLDIALGFISLLLYI